MHMSFRSNPVLHRASWLASVLSVLIFVLTACAGGISVPQTPLPPTPTVPPTATPLPRTPAAPFTTSGQVRPLLMAHFMPWYQASKLSRTWGWHWSMNFFVPTQSENGEWQNLASHYTPLTGPYDSSDEQVLEYQVQLMKLSGIDGVIVDWYGSEAYQDYGLINDSTAKLFQTIKKAGLKFVICYEDQTIKNMIADHHIEEKDAISQGQKVMSYLQSTWFGEEAYLKVNGRPVLFTFGPQYYKSGSQWKTLFSVIDPQPLFITLDNPTDTVAAGSYPWPPMWISKGGELSQDALLKYLTDFYNKSKNYTYHVGGAFPGFHDIYKEAKVGSSYGYLDAQGGNTFRTTLQEALNRNLDMIQLITWNDYGEGTIIEPTVQFEYRYLEMVQAVQQAVSGGKFTFKADDLRLPYQLYQLRVKYAADTAITAELTRAADAILAGDLTSAAKIIGKHQ